MNKAIILSALTASLLASFAVQAADTTELKVKGIIRPSACTPSFTGGGTVDYGTIGVKSLSTTGPTVLAEKTLAFNVTCDAATKIALHAADNRKSSTVTGLVSKTVVPSAGDSGGFGLGSVGGKNIGIYTVRFIPGSISADGTTPDTIYDRSNGTWTKASFNAFTNDGLFRHSFAAAGTVIPGAYKTISLNIGVQAVIDNASNLPTTQDIPLDGSATIEVQYL